MNFFLPVKIITYLIICLSFISNSYAEVKPTLLRTVSLTNIVKSPSDVRFNPEGTRIFFSDFRSGADVLIQFDVDTPFNISTIDFNSKVELATNGSVDNIQQPQGFEFNNALKTASGMSLISMISMEVMMNLTDFVLTGGAILTWWVIPIMLIVGFLTPWPYNYWRLKKYGINCH